LKQVGLYDIEFNISPMHLRRVQLTTTAISAGGR